LFVVVFLAPSAETATPVAKTFIVWVQLFDRADGGIYESLFEGLNARVPARTFSRHLQQDNESVPLPPGQYVLTSDSKIESVSVLVEAVVKEALSVRDLTTKKPTTRRYSLAVIEVKDPKENIRVTVR
jgi:hypothetical protein